MGKTYIDKLIEILNNISVEDIDEKYKNGDFLYFNIDGKELKMKMSYYSMESVPGTEQSRWVSYSLCKDDFLKDDYIEMSVNIDYYINEIMINY